MEKPSPSDPPNIHQLDHIPSDIQSNEEYITFISLSHYQMHKLIHDTQSFNQKIKSINKLAKKQIELGAYKEALGLLVQGEKILEYAAGSGKTIERGLIICILHNIAATFHKLWVLDKCLRYVEGLVFNLENHLHSQQNSVASSNKLQQIQNALHNLETQKTLAAYSLRFCALCSQQEKHKEALHSAKKAINYIRTIVTFDEEYMKSLFRQERESQQKAEMKYRLLVEILEYENTMNYKKHRDILKAAHFSIQIWNKEKQKNVHPNYKFLKNYSIGDFMDFKALQYHSIGDNLSFWQKQQKEFESSIVFLLLILSIGFFSASTEIRLNLSDVQKQYHSQLQCENGSQLIQAEIYHLLSIILITAFLPYDILYIKHVLNSYSNYFDSGLFDYKTVQKESYEKILELIGDFKIKSPYPGSTEIISSQQVLLPPEAEGNQYRLKDHFLKQEKKRVQRTKKNPEKNTTKKSKSKSNSKNFSSLESKSIIKDAKKGSKGKVSIRLESKINDKTKSKHKSKSKTLDKKSKERNYLYIKVSTNKSGRKQKEQETVSIVKKLSPKKSKQIIGSQIIHKHSKKNLANYRIPSIKKVVVSQYKSPKRRQNIYGLNY